MEKQMKCENSMANQFPKTKEISIAEFKKIWEMGGTFVDAQFSNSEKHDYLFVSKDNGKSVERIWAVKNISKSFLTGWVGANLHSGAAHQWEEKEVPHLPEDWDEVSLRYLQYPNWAECVVARNNHDGTVQIFHPTFHKIE